jgi:glucosamine-6-phosphate deaminase
MKSIEFTPVEKSFFEQSGRNFPTTRIPYIIAPNFPKLGLMTALRFVEWAAENPTGVIQPAHRKNPRAFYQMDAIFIKPLERCKSC